MTDKAEDKAEALPDLDDLLQCPVCYEIPTGQIFQCNEGHHVCGRCKMRLDVCPVCRAFFFGTRNYAMEELIANIKKLRAFKLGGKVTTETPTAEAPGPKESIAEMGAGYQMEANTEEDTFSQASSLNSSAPRACKGLFRCLCCKINPERLPLARLLNHLRYYHAPELIEGRSENSSYLQAWQFPTAPGRMVTAVRVHDMGIFFLVVEILHNHSIMAWLSMAASPYVAQGIAYSLTLSGNDREAIFSDSVWSVRSCEGTLKKRGHCLSVQGADARAMLAGSALAGKLCVRRETGARVAEPRAVLRRANRTQQDIEPFLLDLQLDVARLSRAFSMLGREATALIRSEPASPPAAPAPAPAPDPEPVIAPAAPLSRGARRRMRQRLRAAFRENQAPEPVPPPQMIPAELVPPHGVRRGPGFVAAAPRPTPPPHALPPRPAPPQQLEAAPRPAPPQNNRSRNVIIGTGVSTNGLQAAPRRPPAQRAAAAPASSAQQAEQEGPPAAAPGSSQQQPAAGAGSARSKKNKKRRQRR